MGFAAAAVGGASGLSGDVNCGQCFELLFEKKVHDDPGGNWGGSHPDLVGKRHVVQVTNIGNDVGEGGQSFDLLIPGAGQGEFTNGCKQQFAHYVAGDFDCDNRYGGCDNKSGCERLPGDLRQGCYWRYDWLRWLASGGETNNPYVSFRRVLCPEQLTRISGSTPIDDGDHPAHGDDDGHPAHGDGGGGTPGSPEAPGIPVQWLVVALLCLMLCVVALACCQRAPCITRPLGGWSSLPGAAEPALPQRVEPAEPQPSRGCCLLM